MASFKIYEKKDKVTKKGIPLVFVIYNSGNTYKVKTGLHCKPYAWKQEAQMVDGKKDSKAAVINNKLGKARIALQDIISAQHEFNIDMVRAQFQNYLKPNSVQVIERESEIPAEYLKRYEGCTEIGKKFFKLIEGLIEEHKNDWSKGYKKRFRTIRTKLLKFEPNFTPQMLTEKFWRKFVTFCIDKLGNVSNTINTDCSALVVLIKTLRKEGYVFEKGLEDKIVWRYIEPKVAGLSWDRVMKIASLDLSHKKSYTIRDTQIMWLIGAFTGRRFSEVCNMTRDNFYKKDGEWWYKNIGKGQRLIDIPLIKEAVDLLKKIDFKIPHITDSKRVNDDIKEICKEAGFDEKILVITPIDKNTVKREKMELYKTVTFHTSRHSFGQHIAEISSGKPHAEKFISFMLGHTSYQTSWKYLNRVESSNEKMFKELGL